MHIMRIQLFNRLFLAVFVLFSSGATAWAASGTFSWLPNSETNLAGYKIHYGTASKTYTVAVNVGKPELVNGRVAATVTGLNDGTTYYFAATAYDSTGTESGYSEEVVYTTAQALPAPVVKSITSQNL